MEEIGKLQGFPSDLIPWVALKIPSRKFGAMMGNAMTLPVMLTLLPIVLHLAGKIDMAQAAVLKGRAAHFDVLAKIR